LSDQFAPCEKGTHKTVNIAGYHRRFKYEHDDSKIFGRRIVPDIGEVEVAGQDCLLFGSRELGDLRIGRAVQPDIAHMARDVAVLDK
jgi:hypothetical protein